MQGDERKDTARVSLSLSFSLLFLQRREDDEERIDDRERTSEEERAGGIVAEGTIESEDEATTRDQSDANARSVHTGARSFSRALDLRSGYSFSCNTCIALCMRRPPSRMLLRCSTRDR